MRGQTAKGQIMAGSEYHVKIIIDTKDQTSGPAKKAAGGLDALKTAAKLAAGAFIVLKAAQKGLEFVKFGAGIGRAATALDNLAKGAGMSGDAIIKSIQGASDYTIDRMTAMSVANKALIMEVAKSPAEFERLTKVAVKLGRAMGIDAAGSIDRFVVASARRSIKIADDIGLVISATKANEKYAAANGLLVDELTAAEQSQAFLNEMLTQGERKIAVLGDTTDDAATQVEQLESAWKNLYGTIAEGTAEMVANTGIMSKLAQEMTVGAEAMALIGEAAAKSGQEVGRGIGAHAEAVEKAIISSRTWQEDEDELRATLEKTIPIIDTSTGAVAEYDMSIINLSASLADASSAQIAQAALTELKTAYDDGKITVDQYKTAITETQLAFGLATGKSIALSAGVLDLTGQLIEGSIKAGDFATKLGTMIGEADRGVLVANRLRDALNGIPRNVAVSINVQERIARRERDLTSPGQQMAGGGYSPGGMTLVGELGPEMVRLPTGSHVTPASVTNDNRTYNFDQTVNTRATTHSLMNDFALAEFQAG